MAMIPTQSKYPDRAGYLGLDIDRNVLSVMSDGKMKSISIPEGWVNVKDFGAKGDGVTDDTQAFIEALSNNPSVFIPKGIYLISDTIDLSNIQTFIIQGSGEETIIKFTTDQAKFIFYWLSDLYKNEKAYRIFRNMYFEGNSNNIGIQIGNGTGKAGHFVNIENITFESFDKAIYFNNGLENNILESHFLKNNYAVSFENYSNINNFSGCYFRFNYTSCINNQGNNSFNVFNNSTFEGNYGKTLIGTSEVTTIFNNCWFEKNNMSYPENPDFDTNGRTIFNNCNITTSGNFNDIIINNSIIYLSNKFNVNTAYINSSLLPNSYIDSIKGKIILNNNQFKWNSNFILETKSSTFEIKFPKNVFTDPFFSTNITFNPSISNPPTLSIETGGKISTNILKAIFTTIGNINENSIYYQLPSIPHNFRIVVTFYMKTNINGQFQISTTGDLDIGTNNFNTYTKWTKYIYISKRNSNLTSINNNLYIFSQIDQSITAYIDTFQISIIDDDNDIQILADGGIQIP